MASENQRAASEDQRAAKKTGQELHDTMNASEQGDLPPEVRENLPERYSDQSFTMASDPMDATVKNSSATKVPLVDEDAGEVYVVTLQDITWQQVNQALTDALVPSTSGDGKLDFGAFYREVARAKIVEVEPEVPEEQLATWLTGVKEGIGKQLQQHLPDPVDNIEESEAKN